MRPPAPACDAPSLALPLPLVILSSDRAPALPPPASDRVTTRCASPKTARQRPRYWACEARDLIRSYSTRAATPLTSTADALVISVHSSSALSAERAAAAAPRKRAPRAARAWPLFIRIDRIAADCDAARSIKASGLRPSGPPRTPTTATGEGKEAVAPMPPPPFTIPICHPTAAGSRARSSASQSNPFLAVIVAKSTPNSPAFVEPCAADASASRDASATLHAASMRTARNSGMDGMHRTPVSWSGSGRSRTSILPRFRTGPCPRPCPCRAYRPRMPTASRAKRPTAAASWCPTAGARARVAEGFPCAVLAFAPPERATA